MLSINAAATKGSFLRSDKQIAFVYQPMVKFVSGVPAVSLAYLPDLLMLFRTFLLRVQLQLNRTPYLFAELSAFVVNVSLNRHHLPSFQLRRP
jgi:hypothetical protein